MEKEWITRSHELFLSEIKITDEIYFAEIKFSKKQNVLYTWRIRGVQDKKRLYVNFLINVRDVHIKCYLLIYIKK